MALAPARNGGMNLAHLAQVNIGRFLAPRDDPANKDFMDALAHVNARAEAAPGFVWRLTGEGDNAIDLNPFEDPDMAINLSVWTDMNALAAFVYRDPEHRAFMRRRKEWFAHMAFYLALWWIPEGHRPTMEEARERLARLAADGPGPQAFTFKAPFPPPDDPTR